MTRSQRFITCVVLALIVPVSACRPDINPTVTVKPDFLPLQFTFDFEGNVTVSFSPSLVTPLGVISVSAQVPAPLNASDSVLAVRKRHAKMQPETQQPPETIYVYNLHGIQTSKTPLGFQAQRGVAQEVAGNTTTLRVAEDVRELKVDAADPNQVQRPSGAAATTTQLSEPAIPNTSSTNPSVSTSISPRPSTITPTLPPYTGPTGPGPTGRAPSSGGHT